MLAVTALLEALRGHVALDRIAIGTTRWIVEDPAADVVGLGAVLCEELLAAFAAHELAMLAKFIDGRIEDDDAGVRT